MTRTQSATRPVRVYASLAAVISLVVTPLLALSFFAIPDGAGELKSGTVSAWAKPARDAFGSLLTFASHDRVYATYVQIFAVLFPAVVLVAWISWRGRRTTASRFERWTWRVALTGYSLIAIGLVAVSLVLITASPSSSVTNYAFVPFIVPGILLGTIGSSALGIALIRSAYRPRLTSWVLALSFPLWIVGSDVLGHNSLGLVPLFIAWAASVQQSGNEQSRQPTPDVAPSGVAARV